MTFEPKNANNIFFFIQNQRILDRRAFAHCKLESGGQQLPVIKKNCSGNRFNLEKSSFCIKGTKNIRFYPNHRMLNSYTFVLSRIKIKNVFSTINKRKNLCIPYTAGKNNIFIKNHKNAAF